MKRQQLEIIVLLSLVGIFLFQNKEQIAGEVMKRLARGYRNNNPGNLKDTDIPWQGAIGNDGVFEIFDTMENGSRAASKDVKGKISRGLNTVRKLIEVYAPPKENNTEKYISTVCAALNVTDSTVLNWELVKYPLMKAIFKHENGYLYETEKLERGISQA